MKKILTKENSVAFWYPSKSVGKWDFANFSNKKEKLNNFDAWKKSEFFKWSITRFFERNYEN